MELARVDSLIEAVFDEYPEEGDFDPAQNRMKKFFPDETALPADDGEGLWRSVENAYRSAFLQHSHDLNSWEQAKEQIKSEFMGSPAAQAAARKRLNAGGGQAGRSLSQMVPKTEWANKDDLVDFYSRASREQDPTRREAMMKEFGAHKAEFEARLHRLLDTLING